MKSLVSVIIPCRNEAATLSRCLDSVLRSDYPADCMEVLVVDGASDDSSRALLEFYAGSDPRVRILDNPARHTPSALNLAMDAARGSYILRVDAHSIISPGYIDLAVTHLENSGDWGVGGAMRTVPERPGVFADPISIVLSHRFGVGNSQFRTAGAGCEVRVVDAVFNACWRRSTFDSVGRFDERLLRSQDIDFSSRIRRAGGQLVLLPHMETTYYAKSSFRAFIRQNWSNGVWALLPIVFLGSLPVAWRHLVPLLFVATLLLSLGLMPFLPGFGWLLLAVAGAYSVLNGTVSAQIARERHNTRLVLLLPPTFAALHLAYGAGSLWGAARVIASFFRRPVGLPGAIPIQTDTQ